MTILTRKQRLKLSDQQSDPFATQAGPSDDPFAAQAAPSPADEIAATPPEATDPSDPSIPTVNREGEPVEETPAETPVAPSAEPVDPAATPATDAPAPASAPEQPQEAPQEPQAASQPPVEGIEGVEAAPTPQPPQNGGERAAGPRGGKGDLRYYKIAYQTGPTSWEFHKLDTVPEGVEVETLDGERWIKARNNEHALRLGYAVLGAPTDGVTVWPVPKGAYKPKRVKPAPPRPERTRLVIG